MKNANGKSCEYNSRCEAYFEDSWTCLMHRETCTIYEQFVSKQIENFKVPGVIPDKVINIRGK